MFGISYECFTICHKGPESFLKSLIVQRPLMLILMCFQNDTDEYTECHQVRSFQVVEK